MRRAFTLLEVLIALAILAVSLVVLVDAQATAVFMTRETDRIFTATLLAQEKMSEVKLYVETEGFVDKDLEEQGTFDDYEIEALEIDFEDAFEGYEWAYTIREVELSLGGDISGMADTLGQSGYFGEDAEAGFGADQTEERGLEDLGVQPDMITEMLSPYIREVRVRVWWGEVDPDDPDENAVELVTHLINPSGIVENVEQEE